MMMLTPVATATPDGKFDLNDHRLIPTLLDKTGQIEAIDEAHRFELMNKVHDNGIYRKEFRPKTPTPTIGSRRAVRMEFGYMRRSCGGFCKWKRSAESRTHELHKSRLRIQRRRNVEQDDI